MTGLAIIIYQIFAKEWFVKMNKLQHGWVRLSTFYFTGFVILHYPIPILLLLEKQYYHVNWVQDRYLSSTMFIFLSVSWNFHLGIFCLRPKKMVLETCALCDCFCRPKHPSEHEYPRLSGWVEFVLHDALLFCKYINVHSHREICLEFSENKPVMSMYCITSELKKAV